MMVVLFATSSKTWMIFWSCFIVIISIGLGLFMWSSKITLNFAELMQTQDRPTGHLQPLGSHEPPVENGIDVVDTFPSSASFFKNYILPGKPVVFQQLASFMPAFSRWTNEFLSEHYGQQIVTVEARKVEDRKGPVLNLTLAEFLKIYKSEDVYLVHSATYEMLDDVHVPSCLLCDDLLKVMNDVVLWMSSGGTKSVLHYDELDNINCVLDGFKEFFLVDKIKETHIPITDYIDGYSNVDVDCVDMYRYPGLRDVPWYNVTLFKGDCLFIPFRWFHQVRSYGDRNLAINLWFEHLYWIDEQLCQGSETVLDAVPFKDLDFCVASECLRAELVGMANGSNPMMFKTFQEIYGPFVDLHISVDYVFKILDNNNDGQLSLEEMYKPNASHILDLFSRFWKNRN